MAKIYIIFIRESLLHVSTLLCHLQGKSFDTLWLCLYS
jgi:hypothetical protein